MLFIITLWNMLDDAVISGGVILSLIVVGCFVYIIIRESNDHPVLPWGARMRLARAQANLEFDAVEVKRLGLDFQRTKVMEAIEKDDLETVKQLALPSGNKDRYDY